MKRTVAQAESWLDDVGAVLPAAARAEAQREIDQAKAAAANFASGVAGDRAADIDAYREVVLKELCEVRDAYAQLAKDGQAGKLTGAEYLQRLNELQGREISCSGPVSEVAEVAAFVSEIEEDPLAYADTYASRNPANQFDFSF